MLKYFIKNILSIRHWLKGQGGNRSQVGGIGNGRANLFNGLFPPQTPQPMEN